ncbi:MAG TPA: nucleotide exchange factor GrpE [Streptosporangiaceae bacterium]|nr:nucleotide exchange factor GrpE [Streptosporangiaceae bacterium]
MSASEDQGQGPVIRDRRRIDPVTGQPRGTAEPAGVTDAPAGRAGQPRPGKHAVTKPGSARQDAAGGRQPPAADTATAAKAGPGTGPAEQPAAGNGPAAKAPADSEVAVRLAERTADLQRVQAEYANYRKRVERDRVAVREQALASVLAELLPVLDDIGRAREHGELSGGFKAVAEALESATTKLGLTGFGEAGEPFDPNVHEALMHSYAADVSEPTCVQILQPGYKVGERILRPARVAVAEPTDPAGARTASGDAEAGQDEDGPAGQDQGGADGAGQAAEDAD